MTGGNSADFSFLGALIRLVQICYILCLHRFSTLCMPLEKKKCVTLIHTLTYLSYLSIGFVVTSCHIAICSAQYDLKSFDTNV